LQRDATTGAYSAQLPAPDAGLALALRLAPTQPLLLQGDAGFSRKGPQPQQASHYYSQPQLAVTGTVQPGGPTRSGRGWLDHEWSDELLAPGATGWDWIGINLSDGGALTAFVLRRADGSVVWAGGSHRPAGGALRVFGADEVRFTPQRLWTSPATGGRYPVEWTITTPAGRHTLRALLDAQELDSRASAGTVYWEGLAELLAPDGTRVGLGYLEMTGRAQALRLG
jgi:predicted secreted hydrolase